MRKKRGKYLDDLLKILKKLEVEEAKAKTAKLMLETQKSLFAPSSINRI